MGVKGTVYLQLEAERSGAYPADDPRSVRNVKVLRATQTRPRQPIAGTVTVKLNLEVPAAAFIPLQPEATIVVPLALTEQTPVVIEATNPNEE